jgi:hypothetical protein
LSGSPSSTHGCGSSLQIKAWLLDKCIALAQAHHHPELTEHTIWEVFEAERPKLVPYAGRFDCFHAVPASVSKTCLVRFDNNKYLTAASAVVRPVEVHAHADRIVIRRMGALSPSTPGHLAVATRFMTHGTTCQCSPASLAHCATAPPSRIGHCLCRWQSC